MRPTVVILTHCADPEAAYGATLVFDTLRIGYPDNHVIVVDNGSHEEVLPLIASLATQTGCEFVPAQSFHFLDHFRWFLLEQNLYSSVVFLDPDVVFWSEMKFSKTPKLLNGRLIPSFKKNGVVSTARLHPSHLYVPDVFALRQALNNIPTWGFNPLGQTSAAIDGVLYSWDTCAPMYHALKDDCEPFAQEQLNCYDHLFYGSHLRWVKSLKPTDAPMRAHTLVKEGRVSELRGIWRDQDEYFARMN